MHLSVNSKHCVADSGFPDFLESSAIEEVRLEAEIWRCRAIKAERAVSCIRTGRQTNTPSDSPIDGLKSLNTLIPASLASRSSVESSEQREYPLPDDLFDSPEWRKADYAGRVAWMSQMLLRSQQIVDQRLQRLNLSGGESEANIPSAAVVPFDSSKSADPKLLF